MKQVTALFTLLLLSFSTLAQTGVGDDFSASTLSSAWVQRKPQDSLYQYKNQLIVICNNDGANYLGFTYNFSPIDVSSYPYVSIKVKSAVAFTLRIDMMDINGYVTNQNPITSVSVTADGSKYYDYFFDFTGKFQQQYPSSHALNSTQIKSIQFITNPGTGFTGSFDIDSVMVGSRAKTSTIVFPKAIKLNQLGFYTKGYKKAVVHGASGNGFSILSSTNLQDTVYKGTLGTATKWPYSTEVVQMADFTSFNTQGNYVMAVSGVPNSYKFTISDYALNPVSKSSLKGFYFQRASIPIVAQYAGIFTRAEGHPDNHVLIHPSAVSPGRPANAVISCPRGWYDAGDYNKYVVNAGISLFTLLSAYEHFSPYYDTLNLNIPESGNGVPDILDEALWEIRWLLTMQDPYDGGVYNKVTNLNFDNMGVMPADATTTRYVVEKGTTATLDFAALMAQSARILSNFSSQLPGLADSCINAASTAYNWALANPAVYYNQTQMNNTYPSLAVNTGGYGDTNANDEFYWAAAELYTTTQDSKYYPAFSSLPSTTDIPGWPNVATLGLITLSHYRKTLTGIVSDTARITGKITSIAQKYKTYAQSSSAYGIAMGTNTGDFNWGGNSNAGNQSILMLEAFNYAQDSTYLYGAVSNIDYILGRNAPGYCFITGLGSYSPMNIHHGVSSADGLAQPIPGLMPGGPNASPDVAGEGCSTPYPYGGAYPAFNYLDQLCSYSTNEIAINWNAPLCFVTGAVQSLYSGIKASTKSYTPLAPLPTSTVNQINTKIDIQVYPNPSATVLYANKPFELTEKPLVYDVNGLQYNVSGDWSTDKIMINTNELTPGMYLIRLQGANGFAVQKFTIMR